MLIAAKLDRFSRSVHDAIAAKRNPAMWRAVAGIPDAAWVAARGMPGAEVAAVDYAPAGWPLGRA